MTANPIGILFNDPRAKPLSTIGLQQPGAYYQFYVTQTTTPAAVYQDGALTIPLNQTPGTGQTTAAADGRFIPIYMNPATIYRVQLYNAIGQLLEDTDPYIVPVTLSSITAAIVGAALYPQSQTEINNGVTPINLNYPYGNVFRFYTAAQIAQTQAFTASPTLDCSAAINNAVKGTTGDVFFPTGIHYINAPIYIPTTAIQNIRFVGESRTNTKIEPMANSIADGLAINSMIINQAQNEKFSLFRIRLTVGDAPLLQTAWAGFELHAVLPAPWSSTLNYSAGAIVSSSGNYYVCIVANTNQAPPNLTFWIQCGTNSAGYTAANCNVIFSGSIEDCWIDAGGVQPFFVGGLINYFIKKNTFEFQKGCFNLISTSSDVHFEVNSLSNSFDYFVQSAQGLNNNIIRVQGLNTYTHNRGVLFNVANAWAFQAMDITLQPAPGALTSANIGLGSFTNVNDLQLANMQSLTSATLGVGAAATVLTLNTCTGQCSDCIFDGCDTGIAVTGGAMRFSFDHVDVINTLTAAFRTLTAAASGVITANHCNWSDGNTDLILCAVAGSFDFFGSNGRLLNAGLTAGVGARNAIWNTSGTVRMSDYEIGFENVSAAAGVYVENDGTGNVLIIDPTPFGTPPVSFTSGTGPVIFDGVDSTMPGMPALVPNIGGTATYSSQLGRWSLKNKTVNFWIDLTIGTIGTGSTSVILGLPFTSSATYYGGGVGHFFSGSATSIVDLTGSVAPGSSSVQLRSLTAAAATMSNNAIFASGARVIFSGSYPL